MRIRGELNRTQTKPNSNPLSPYPPPSKNLAPTNHHILLTYHTPRNPCNTPTIVDLSYPLPILPNQYTPCNPCLQLAKNRSIFVQKRKKSFETRQFLQKTAQNRSKTLQKWPLFYLSPAQNTQKITTSRKTPGLSPCASGRACPPRIWSTAPCNTPCPQRDSRPAFCHKKACKHLLLGV